MTYSLINKCAKNYYNRTFIVPVIAKNVVTCFFLRHSVHIILAVLSVWLLSSCTATDLYIGLLITRTVGKTQHLTAVGKSVNWPKIRELVNNNCLSLTAHFEQSRCCSVLLACTCTAVTH